MDKLGKRFMANGKLNRKTGREREREREREGRRKERIKGRKVNEACGNNSEHVPPMDSHR